MHPIPRVLIWCVFATVLAGATTLRSLAAFPPGDRPLKIIQTSELRLRDPNNPEIPLNGEVRVVILVDDTGHLTDWLVLGYAHPILAETAVSGLKEWRYEPAVKKGQPVGQRSVVRVFFESRGRIVSIQGGEALTSFTQRGGNARFTNRVAEEGELDQRLGVAEMARPRFPARLVGRGPEASSVLLDFYVDEAGRPRMPVILGSEDEQFSMAALEALDSWRFVPPTRQGKPVVVHVRQEFVFANIEPAAG
jgi:TonB family protein